MDLSYFEKLIESKLLTLHTAYIAKVISVSGNTATVQPLTLRKQFGKAAEKQAVVPSVPILRNARYKIKPITENGRTVAALEFIANGDIVLCVVCERDITDAKNGISSLPAFRHHDISDSVIVGVL